MAANRARRSSEALGSPSDGVPNPAPYPTFGKFLMVVEWVAHQPGRPILGPSVLTSLSLSKSDWSEVRGALQVLDLVDAGGQSTTELVRLARASGDRPSRLEGLLARYYPRALAIVTATGWRRESLDDLFEQVGGRSGPTTQRAVTFFLKMAQDSSVVVAHHAPRRPRISDEASPADSPELPIGDSADPEYGEVLLRAMNRLVEENKDDWIRAFQDLCNRYERLG